MSRLFNKSPADYVSLGLGTVGAVYGGARLFSGAAWIRYATLTTTANDNRVFSATVGSGSTGLMVAVHDGTNPVLRLGARSQAADGFQVGSGTRLLAPNVWYHVAWMFDFTGGKLLAWVNGRLEIHAAATFGATTFTTSAVTTYDGIGAAIGAAGTPATAGSQWDGLIHQLSLYRDRPMSARFARSLMTGSRPGNFGARSYWGMDRPGASSGRVIDGAAGGTLHGTIGGSIPFGPSAPILRRFNRRLLNGFDFGAPPEPDPWIYKFGGEI
jgi:hypothetical protein